MTLIPGDRRQIRLTVPLRHLEFGEVERNGFSLEPGHTRHSEDVGQACAFLLPGACLDT